MSKQERKSAAKAIADTAHQIWLAGLGAYAKAQEEGSKAFEQLITEGTALERQTRKYTRESLGTLRETMTDTTRRLQQSGLAGLEQLQQIVDQRIGKALDQLALPTIEDFRQLATQIARLAGQDAPADDSAPAASTTKARKVKAAPAGKTKRAAESAKPSSAAKTTRPAKVTRASKSSAAKTTRASKTSAARSNIAGKAKKTTGRKTAGSSATAAVRKSAARKTGRTTTARSSKR